MFYQHVKIVFCYHSQAHFSTNTMEFLDFILLRVSVRREQQFSRSSKTLLEHNGIDIIVHAALISPGAMNPVYPLPAFTSRTFRTRRQLELPTDLCTLNCTDSRPQCPEIVRLKEISQSQYADFNNNALHNLAKQQQQQLHQQQQQQQQQIIKKYNNNRILLQFLIWAYL